LASNLSGFLHKLRSLKLLLMKKLFTFLFLTTISTFSFAQLQSPDEFLGYELGSRFSHHYKVVDYFEHVAKNMSNVSLAQYGETYEHRPLITATISSQQNMDKLEEIRINNLRATGLEEGSYSQNDIAIVWLSYNIHGNEASSIEAAMKTIYDLARKDNEKAEKWLENTVVIIDPCINPDGRDRYANFYRQYRNKNFNPDGDAMEHHEPWPGGRPNHYLFDLNRDWAWQTQQESAQRAVAYHKWMPHVHVDFHEQYINSPYYFAPAAEPYHEVITDWQREFQTTIGKNHAKYFDQEGWLYFTKERFDLLYPSYGDTYPTYNGAIGMTYEQAGHGYAGLGILTEYEDTLTLKDRIQHHYTTGISTVEVSSDNADRLSNEFRKYFKTSINNPSATYKSYVIKTSNNVDKIQRLTVFLDKQKIKYGKTSRGRTYKGFSYQTNKSATVNLSTSDLIISAYQPKSKLLTSLFEPVTKLSDSLTYDITAWSLPYAYGLDAYAINDKIEVTNTYQIEGPVKIAVEQTPYAYILNYNSIQDVKWLSDILKAEINTRVSNKPITIEGKAFDRGAIVITKRTNEKFGDQFDQMISKISEKHGRSVTPVYTGFAESGVDLGSGDVSRVKTPEIAVIAGKQTSSLSFGEIWHFFEQQINYPITAIRTDYFSQVDLHDYDVLIVPNGYYSLFNESTMNKVTQWVSSGGKLILIGNALRSFVDTDGFELKRYQSKDAKKEDDHEDVKDEMLLNYEEQERDQLSQYISGAIFKVTLDNTHPIAYGYDKSYFSLKSGSARYAYLESGGNVGTIRGDAQPVSGFAGYKAVEKLDDSLVFGVESKGSGSVIYMVDNPLFRAFWENGKLLFSNAVFIVD